MYFWQHTSLKKTNSINIELDLSSLCGYVAKYIAICIVLHRNQTSLSSLFECSVKIVDIVKYNISNQMENKKYHTKSSRKIVEMDKFDTGTSIKSGMVKLVLRRAWVTQRGNQNPYIEEQTTQWPKEIGHKDKQHK